MSNSFSSCTSNENNNLLNTEAAEECRCFLLMEALFKNYKKNRDREMVKQAKVLSTKPHDLSLTPGTQAKTEGEN
jgi:DNA-binding SARP family transcriptional activator